MIPIFLPSQLYRWESIPFSRWHKSRNYPIRRQCATDAISLNSWTLNTFAFMRFMPWGIQSNSFHESVFSAGFLESGLAWGTDRSLGLQLKSIPTPSLKNRRGGALSYSRSSFLGCCGWLWRSMDLVASPEGERCSECLARFSMDNDLP